MKTIEVNLPLILVVEVPIEEIKDMMIISTLKHLKDIRYTDKTLLTCQAEISIEGIHTVTICYRGNMGIHRNES